MAFVRFLDRIFFERISATGWGALRIAWAGTALFHFLLQWDTVTMLYSAEGIAPPELWQSLFRGDYRFTLLSFITGPAGVWALYSALLCALTLTLVGRHTRAALVCGVVLLFSFHERNLLILGGGDTMLRNVGFLLLISPEIRALSLDRALLQWRRRRAGEPPLPPATMSAWPMRLLLWQYIIIYVTSGWDKMTGSMWLHGTAVASALHHTHFARAPLPMMDLIASASPIIGYGTILWEMAWTGLLVPQEISRRLPQIFLPHAYRRALIAGGILFHGSIQLLMVVGSFSFIMIGGYAGLLRDEDLRDLRTWLNRHWNRLPRRPDETTPAIAVLYDGRCRLCRRSMFLLEQADILHRLRAVDFRNAALRRRIAPDLRLADLDRALHIRFPDGRTAQGFDAFRILCRWLPPLLPLYPLLHVPGVAPLGRRVYARIAARRFACSKGACVHG